MTEAQRIADQLRRACEGEAWHGPALGEVLSGMTGAMAARRPIPGGHSIWEIVLHIATWESIALKRVQGEGMNNVPAHVDWPPVSDTSQAAWLAALENLERGNQALRNAIAGLTDQRLQQTVEGQQYSIYEMLHGVVQHDSYHAGQIALLKKALRNSSSQLGSSTTYPPTRASG